MTSRQIIRCNRERVGIVNDKALMEAAGIPYSTYTHERTDDDGSWRLWEMRELIELTNMPDEDIILWVRGKEAT